jgi:hypothetical protein
MLFRVTSDTGDEMHAEYDMVKAAISPWFTKSTKDILQICYFADSFSELWIVSSGTLKDVFRHKDDLHEYSCLKGEFPRLLLSAASKIVGDALTEHPSSAPNHLRVAHQIYDTLYQTLKRLFNEDDDRKFLLAIKDQYPTEYSTFVAALKAATGK